MNENLYLTANKYNLLNFDLVNILDPVYPLHKVQGHSTQRHCLIFSLKESKFAEFFIWRGSKFHIWLALYAIEYRPFLSVLGPISHEKVIVSNIAPMFWNCECTIHNVKWNSI